MVTTFILFIVCEQAQLINHSSKHWTKEDTISLDLEIESCLEDDKNAQNPCLKSFEKREKDYGLVNMDKKKEKAAANLKKIGVTLKEKNEKR
jgi:hypothetical protein